MVQALFPFYEKSPVSVGVQADDLIRGLSYLTQVSDVCRIKLILPEGELIKQNR